MVDRILHDQFYVCIRETRIPVLASAGGTRFTRMDVFNRSVSEGQRYNRLCLPGKPGVDHIHEVVSERFVASNVKQSYCWQYSGSVCDAQSCAGWYPKYHAASSGNAIEH
jgi:hypothetical protein